MMLGRTMKNASTEFATKSLHEDQVITWECASWHACACSQLAALLNVQHQQACAALMSCTLVQARQGKMQHSAVTMFYVTALYATMSGTFG